jgi:hypothetical protein
MAVQYQVRAQVVDLRTDQPLATDRFYVDTNVWFWVAYPNVQFGSGQSQALRVSGYTNYLQAVLIAKGQLHWCGLSLAELAHLIEKAEFEAYQGSGSIPVFNNAKEYRHGHSVERARVTQTIETAWQSVEGLAQPLPGPTTVDKPAVDAALRAMVKVALDGYDLFALKTLHETKVLQVISDDGDFCIVPGITLYTTNKNVLLAAQAQGKILKR